MLKFRIDKFPACLVLLDLLAAPVVKANVAKPKQSSLWAYPDGVIAVSDGGRLHVPSETNAGESNKPASDEDSQDSGSGNDKQGETDELGQVAKDLEKLLKSCVIELRQGSESWQKTGGKVAFLVEFTIFADGSTDEPRAAKKTGSETIFECAKPLTNSAHKHVFETPKVARPVTASINFEAVILTDSEAKGRGFEYYEGEKAWESVLKAHPKWFACKVDRDCEIWLVKCSARAINKAYRHQLEEGLKAQEGWPSLGEACNDELAKRFHPTCKQRVCQVRRRR